MKPTRFLAALAGGLLAFGVATSQAEEITLRLHQFLPPPATLPAKVVKPWAASIEEASGGRIKFQHYDAMSLGGRPPELYDQARDGVADIIMTVTGYTPNRFPKSEVFELPFMMRGSVATSQAFWELVESELQETEYRDVKMLGAWVHGAGVIHTSDPVRELGDMEGLKVRGPTRVINSLLASLGAVPVGMPLPAIPEALSKGVVSGTVIPWEVTPAIKLSELVGYATEFSGDEALYTATIIMAMNRDRYESLPDDLRQIVDEKSGMALTQLAAREMLAGDAPARSQAVENGTEVIVLEPDEVARWKAAAEPVIAEWVDEVAQRGIDGEAAIEQANELIDKYQ
jgi:TRAP-type C4-dicarboxylate transport system substrate-binding protein